ncbi:hypothetical protein BLNAU_4380 [Blattamonas nauphoetae]|uniref:Uncharacterized protein n=1 Tax=Blattamonas nauphoetae TaxID=2049346 RepID=A0ABQ9YAM0_9EUKA|nr:hypothetical protein BLNAU_4380 [Blattamonas nauphoetae]
MMALLSNCDFPPTLTNFLKTHPEIDVTALLPFENHLTFLCHSALSGHQQDRPPLDLIFERVLRTNPLDFFLHPHTLSTVASHSLINTSLCGFHTLCRRGVHLDLIEKEVIRSGQPLLNSHWLFDTPLIFDTFHLFLYFPPPLVVRFFLPILWLTLDLLQMVEPLKAMISTLLVATAPLGECQRMKELFKSVLHGNNTRMESSQELVITNHCESLELLNIPTGFGSALAHTNTHLNFDHFEHRIKPHISLDTSRKLSSFPTPIPGFMSMETRGVTDRISRFAYLMNTLCPADASIVFEHGVLPTLQQFLLSPVPTVVSVVFEFVKRLVCMSSLSAQIHMVHFGVLDIVIHAVSKSSFLEDYENGICVIGILLRSIRDFQNEQEMMEHDFSSLLSQTGLE